MQPSNYCLCSQMSASSLQSLGASSIQPGQPSSLPLQHRLQSSLDDRHKASVTLSNSTKPLVAPAGEPLVASSGDATSIDKPLNSINAPATVSSSPGSIRPLRGITSTRFGSAMNIETLVAASERRETPIEAPALEIQDKISFIINNISAANVEAKAKEFTEFFKEQYYPWFAQYMVMKSYQWKQFPARVYFFQVLLGSELIKSSSEERSLLKNLGSWLGKFTIGRNQVLKAHLEPCRNSIAYQPPNPWTMGILGLLAEIYVLPNLKMNLKFDIEVLFKNLGVDMKDITPTSLLENRPRQVEGNPDFSNKDIGASHPPMISEVKSAIVSTPNKVELPVEVASPHTGGHTHLLSQYAAPFHLPTGTLMEDEKLVALRLSDQLPSAQGLLQATHHNYRFLLVRVAPIAMDRAIKEILSGMVQRSVNIASQTTKELVLKDYAMESDEALIYNAAHAMEPLRASLARQLGNLLQGLTISNERLEQAVQLVTNDNLDKACAEMERAAADMCFGVKSDVLLMVQLVHPGLEKETTSVASFCDPLVLKDAQVSNLRTHDFNLFVGISCIQAVQTIDKELEIRLSLRRKHREGIGSTFFDGSMYTQGSMAVLPEALRPKPGHLSLSQQQVYEGFVQLPRQNQANEGSNMLPVDSAPPGGAGQSVSHGSALVQLDPTIYSSSPGNSGLMAVSQSLDFVTEDLESTSVQLLRCFFLYPVPLFLKFSSIHFPVFSNMFLMFQCFLNSHGNGDGVIKHISENDSVVASFPSTASASDLHSVEPSDAVKELVTASQSFPSTVASERLGISISEPLVTRDALDKYQMLQKRLCISPVGASAQALSYLETLVTNGASESELQLVDEEGEWVDINTDKEDKITIGYDYIP
ncbi:CCR4-NOT transcription complex subunit 1 [Vitis vinifera]|uniref:CCR4-NOT transcription complex subunit 1 n=1 Tax=Vitis vinifera TaxID=29760 RepID=A0A438IKA9_VITVI|nr:CCR4-NOT transcription complex subunit 1 [Vitis vinifera]